jgi:hypothetical protein
MPKRAATLYRTMPDLLAAVNARMKELDWSSYRLVQELRGKRPGGKNVPPATVYEFLRGETPINSRDLGLILDAIGLDLTSNRKPPR